VNLGDSYANPNGNSGGCSPKSTLTGGGGKYREGSKNEAMFNASAPSRRDMAGLKPKDLVGIPWRVAFALQADGWYLRSDIIWHKPNPMPESVTDRPTKSHEYIFLLSKSSKYYYDADAVKEQATYGENRATFRGGGAYTNNRSFQNDKKVIGDGEIRERPEITTRNRRSVWTVVTKPFKGAHFATFPEALIAPCILAGSRVGDVVLDPFNGAGTTGVVALKNGRSYIGLELNPEYMQLTQDRLAQVQYALT
jgi:DNA modification methylase